MDLDSGRSGVNKTITRKIHSSGNILNLISRRLEVDLEDQCPSRDRGPEERPNQKRELRHGPNESPRDKQREVIKLRMGQKEQQAAIFIGVLPEWQE